MEKGTDIQYQAMLISRIYQFFRFLMFQRGGNWSNCAHLVKILSDVVQQSQSTLKYPWKNHVGMRCWLRPNYSYFLTCFLRSQHRWTAPHPLCWNNSILFSIHWFDKIWIGQYYYQSEVSHSDLHWQLSSWLATIVFPVCICDVFPSKCILANLSREFESQALFIHEYGDFFLLLLSE